MKLNFRVVMPIFFTIGIVLISSYIAGETRKSEILQEEILITPSDNWQMITENSYSGLVNITFSGYLNSPTGNETIDMYYMFEAEDKYVQIDAQSLLKINGNIALPPNHAGLPPPYVNEHIYTFNYFVGNENYPIEFMLTSQDFMRYDGILTIHIENIPNYGGR